MTHIDVAAAHTHTVARDLADPRRIDEDAPALHERDETNDSRRAITTRHEDDVVDATDGGSVGRNERQAEQPRRIHDRCGHGLQATPLAVIAWPLCELQSGPGGRR